VADGPDAAIYGQLEQGPGLSIVNRLTLTEQRAGLQTRAISSVSSDRVSTREAVIAHDNSGWRGYGVEVLWRRALWVMNPKGG